jgi:GDPmannose 4,6-dehydratase
VDPAFYRPAEVDILLGDATKARQSLGWEPRHSFRKLVQEMVQNDLELLSNRPNPAAMRAAVAFS